MFRTIALLAVISWPTTDNAEMFVTLDAEATINAFDMAAIRRPPAILPDFDWVRREEIEDDAAELDAAAQARTASAIAHSVPLQWPPKHEVQHAQWAAQAGEPA